MGILIHHIPAPGVWIVAPDGLLSRAARVTADGIPQNGMLIIVTTAYCPLTAALTMCISVTNRARRKWELAVGRCRLRGGLYFDYLAWYLEFMVENDTPDMGYHQDE